MMPAVAEQHLLCLISGTSGHQGMPMWTESIRGREKPETALSPGQGDPRIALSFYQQLKIDLKNKMTYIIYFQGSVRNIKYSMKHLFATKIYFYRVSMRS